MSDRGLMSVDNLDATIMRLRQQGRDDGTCEVKECAHDLSKDIWETVSAFANTEGGDIVLGLSERNGFMPVENFDLYRVRDQFIAGIGDSGEEGRLINPPHYSITPCEFNSAQLLVIRIDELDPSRKPCYIEKRGVQGGSYKRIDDADIPLSANEIYSLQNACINTGSDRVSVTGASIEDLNEEIYAQTFVKAEEITPRALLNANDLVTKLKRLNFVDGQQGVTKAGLLVAGYYPQQFYPKLHVDVAVHLGSGKASDSSVRFMDRVICEGTIGEMLEGAVEAVSKNLRRMSTVQGVGREDELEIPVEVLREAIANALIHRDYDSRFEGESIAIDIYDDRVEIVNPGGLWGGKSRTNLADGRSCCRNATLMRLLSLSELPSTAGSPAEGNGTGILLMINEMLKRHLRRPDFRPAIDHFRVVLYRPNGNAKQSKRDVGEATIVSLLLEYGELSIHELGEMGGLTINQARNRVRELLDDGIVEATAPPTSKNRKYRFKRR